MEKIVPDKTYKTLLKDISILCDHAQKTIVNLYWQIGRHILEVEQKYVLRAPYGSMLLTRLSDDLVIKYGKGFSITNLKNMRKFYLNYQKGQTSDQMEWSKYVVLLTIHNLEKRAEIEKRAIRGKALSARNKKSCPGKSEIQ